MQFQFCSLFKIQMGSESAEHCCVLQVPPSRSIFFVPLWKFGCFCLLSLDESRIYGSGKKEKKAKKWLNHLYGRAKRHPKLAFCVARRLGVCRCHSPPLILASSCPSLDKKLILIAHQDQFSLLFNKREGNETAAQCCILRFLPLESVCCLSREVS
jgi:hypothetical protein